MAQLKVKRGTSSAIASTPIEDGSMLFERDTKQISFDIGAERIPVQAGGDRNVQSDWNETDISSDAYIQNKPSIPTKTSDLTNDSDFGTVTSVATGAGLTGGTITESGTIKASLKSERKASESAIQGNTIEREYAVRLDADGYLSVNVPWANSKVLQTSTSTAADYDVLFAESANDHGTRTEGTRKANNLKFNPSTGNLQATQLNGVTIGTNPKFTDTNTTYTASTASIGSASAGTAIAADDITAWSAGTAASAAVSKGTLTITNGAVPSLSYTARSIPNISVTSKTVVTGITAS